jgi:hypothetical protein
LSIAADGEFNERPARNYSSKMIQKMKLKTLARIYSSAETVADRELQPIALPSAPLAAILKRWL